MHFVLIFLVIIVFLFLICFIFLINLIFIILYLFRSIIITTISYPFTLFSYVITPIFNFLSILHYLITRFVFCLIILLIFRMTIITIVRFFKYFIQVKYRIFIFFFIIMIFHRLNNLGLILRIVIIAFYQINFYFNFHS